MSIGVTSMLEAGLGAKPEDVHAEGPALPAKVTGRLGDKGVLGVATGTSPAAGCGEDHKGSEASQPQVAYTSPHTCAPTVLVVCISIFGVTLYPSLGRGDWLSRSLRLCSCRGTFCLQGLL